ncbi:MAG TPA: heparan-alpha-glucosaminide N-acetyltransferase domain-containing protein [Gemmatimonadales bacterium]|nr:heparan-alpha-glucosaminide N-acetyltransferase domain-containing protein [Gemmatimonadales bacterium]
MSWRATASERSSRADAAVRPFGGPAVRPSDRLAALDVFRGLTVAAMILVNNPGSWSAVYPPLRHAAWHGWTPTDLVFPFFLFIVGITTHLSIAARRVRGASDRQIAGRIVRRALLIIALGLLLSAFPFFPADRITHLRIPGVLQRIGVAYLVAAPLVLRTTPRVQVGVITAILAGYWLLLTRVPVPGLGRAALEPPDATLAAWLDRLVLDGHLWAVTRTWDPEGILSTIPAVATTLVGALAGRAVAPDRQRLGWLAGWGAVTCVAGLAWAAAFPINKNLWTSSYVLFTAGAAALVLAACIRLFRHGAGRWAEPFVVFGVNPITAFVGSEALARLMYSVIRVPYGGETVSLQQAIHRAVFASWLPDRPASLAFAVAVVLLWYVVLRALRTRGIILRI